MPDDAPPRYRRASRRHQISKPPNSSTNDLRSARQHLFPAFHQSPDQGRENQLQRQIHLAARAYDGVGERHEGVMQHRQQVRKVDSPWFVEVYDEHLFFRRRDMSLDEWVRGFDHWHSLEVVM